MAACRTRSRRSKMAIRVLERQRARLKVRGLESSLSLCLKAQTYLHWQADESVLEAKEAKAMAKTRAPLKGIKETSFSFPFSFHQAYKPAGW